MQVTVITIILFCHGDNRTANLESPQRNSSRLRIIVELLLNNKINKIYCIALRKIIGNSIYYNF